MTSTSGRRVATTTRGACAVVFLFVVATVGSKGARAQTYTDLYDFGAKYADPGTPMYSGILAQGRDGNLYGTTSGTTNGDIFKITPAGQFTLLHRFSGADGSYAASGLTLGTDGNFYGATASGGKFANGTVFKVTSGGKLTTLYNFTGADDGGDPIAPPIQGTDGKYYGTTGVGGNPGSDGTVYKIKSSGTLTTLHSFGYGMLGFSNGGLVQGTDGFLYGTTAYGGVFGERGTIFQISLSGAFTDLHDFNFYDGEQPLAPLVEDDNGFFYGVTAAGGQISSPSGTMFQVTTSGGFDVMHYFVCCGGSSPFGGFVLASDGNFYGTTAYSSGVGGTIWQVAPDWTYTDIYSFNCTTGCKPMAALVQHTNGKLYGTTFTGGSHHRGVLFSFDLGLPPFVRLVTAIGAAGNKVGILGQGFKGTTAVSFNGVAATFTVVSDTYLTATVPGTATTGTVTVTTPTGVLSSNRKFTVN